LLWSVASKQSRSKSPKTRKEASLKRAASRDGKALDAVLRAAGALCSGQTALKATALAGDTFETLGKRWTSGELARDYPDHVPVKKTAEQDAGRLELYVYPIVPDVAVADFRLEHAEAVMRALPSERSKASQIVVFPEHSRG
jgi:hypothetical protein